MDQTFDVAVIGGGPAGTTIATLLARQGRRICLFEKDTHPRFHIGESLLPMNLPIFDRLGLTEQIERIGVRKLGADFTAAGSDAPHRTFHFSRAIGHNPAYAYEVRRSEFDAALFGNALAHGVAAQQRHAVERIERGRDGTFALIVRDQTGASRPWRARFVVDASGRDCFVAGREGWKRRNPRHASAAIFGHYRNVIRRTGEDAGNISVYWFEHGWIWMIPLREDVMSIGAVCTPDYLKTRHSDVNAFLEQTLKLCPEAWERMAEAVVDRPATATGNYSYESRRFGEPGMLLVGDAYAFIDPVFSSGVYIAMSSAANAVPVVDAWLRNDKLRYVIESLRYRHKVRRALRTFSWFIYRFTTPAMRNLFAKPRDVFGAERAVISMLAGDVYSSLAVRLRLKVFKALYAAAFLFAPGKSLHRVS